MRQRHLCFFLLGVLGLAGSCATGRSNWGVKQSWAADDKVKGAVSATDPGRLTLERIYDSNDFKAKSVERVRWLEDGSGYMQLKEVVDANGVKEVVFTDPNTGESTVHIAASRLVPPSHSEPLVIEDYQWSEDRKTCLLFCDAVQVWRTKTRGDYWLLDVDSNDLFLIGGDAEAASLMFAKLSPDASQVAYVHEKNLYVQTLADRSIRQVTQRDSDEIINGTSDWVYEEELRVRDAFRWSPNGEHLAYWQFDTEGMEAITLVNTTDALYHKVTRLKYPKAGQTNPAVRVGVVSARGGETHWLDIPGDPREHYIQAMDWLEDSNDLIIQQLNRLQNTHHVYLSEVVEGVPSEPRLMFTDRDDAWLNPDVRPLWSKDGRSFLWLSERDGWSHLYRVSRDSGEATLLSPGLYDVISVVKVDEDRQWIYVMASPEDPGQRYLYRLPLAGGAAQRVTPADQPGTHSYSISEKADWAVHTWSQFDRVPVTDLVRLPDLHPVRVLEANESLAGLVDALTPTPSEFFRVDANGVTLDGWCIKPPDFDPTRKYPLLIYVYGEPAGQTVKDSWAGKRVLWHRMLAQEGYLVVSIDNRGTPAPKGRKWRKCVYRKVGLLPAEDQAAALRTLIKQRPYIDADRVGVWGWSGGGSMTLNALFRYPDLYHVGMAVAFVADMHYYDTIYQERYMGLPQDNEEDYVQGSPITFAQHLQGDLLLVYGTGDDNCHYQNCEALVNKLVEHNKVFTMMAYPNRRHRISKGKNTSLHLYGLLTRYLKEHLPPGGY